MKVNSITKAGKYDKYEDAYSDFNPEKRNDAVKDDNISFSDVLKSVSFSRKKA